MNIFIISCAFLITYCSGSEPGVLECEFKVNTYYGLYGCYVVNDHELIRGENDREILRFRGRSLDGKSAKDVTLFFAEKKKIKFFPRGLTNHFKNIVYVSIGEAELQELTKEDLQPFGDKLKFLLMGGNKIEYLEKDLFSFNPNVEMINFSGNEIRHIDNAAFNGLKKVHTLFLQGNFCTDDSDLLWVLPDRIPKLISKVQASCKDEKIANLVENRHLKAENSKLKEQTKKLEKGVCA